MHWHRHQAHRKSWIAAKRFETDPEHSAVSSNACNELNYAEQARGICNEHNYARLDLRCLALSASRGRPGHQVRAGTIWWLTMSKTPPQDIPG